MKIKAIARLRATADRTGVDIQPDQIVHALGERLNATIGPLKEIKVRVPGKFNVRVFMGKPNKGLSLVKMLNDLDFTTLKNDSTKTFGGTRLETNGKLTYVTYQSPAGMVIVTTNTDSIDL